MPLFSLPVLLCYHLSSKKGRFGFASALALSLCLSACQKNDKPNQVIMAQSSASTPAHTVASTPAAPVLRPNVSQQFVGTSPIEVRLAYALPEIPYTTDNLSDFAQSVNAATIATSSVATALASSASATSNASAVILTPQDIPVTPATHTPAADASLSDTASEFVNLTQAQIIKLQALLNWHGHGVGAVNGTMNPNVIKAMQVFQKKHNLPVTKTLNEATWQALTANDTLNKQPVLINYTLTKDDVHIPYHKKGMQYRSVKEAIAERFHMSQKLLTQLNPKTPLKAGETITVYNPYQPNMMPVAKVVTDKRKNILYAYDAKGELVASYPTTVGSHYTPSPSGNLKVINRVINPSYNSDFSRKDTVLPPGPNNPVGRVWIGLSKQGYGIHGSPEPEMISQQKSHGCVRLTNWDALALFGTISDGAAVEFL